MQIQRAIGLDIDCTDESRGNLEKLIAETRPT